MVVPFLSPPLPRPSPNRLRFSRWLCHSSLPSPSLSFPLPLPLILSLYLPLSFIPSPSPCFFPTTSPSFISSPSLSLHLSLSFPLYHSLLLSFFPSPPSPRTTRHNQAFLSGHSIGSPCRGSFAAPRTGSGGPRHYGRARNTPAGDVTHAVAGKMS